MKKSNQKQIQLQIKIGMKKYGPLSFLSIPFVLMDGWLAYSASGRCSGIPCTFALIELVNFTTLLIVTSGRHWKLLTN